MSDAQDAAEVLAGFVPIDNDHPRVQEFAEAVRDTLAASTATPQKIADRLVLFVSTGGMTVTRELHDYVRQELLRQLPEIDDVIVVPGSSVSIHRLGGPL